MLEVLTMSNCNVDDDGAQALADGLQKNVSLLYFDISDNDKITSIGAGFFAEALKINTHLKTLRITSDKIGAEGLKNFASALKVNKTLTELELDCQFIRDEVELKEIAKAFIKALQQNNTLKYLYLPNHITREIERVLLDDQPAYSAVRSKLVERSYFFGSIEKYLPSRRIEEISSPTVSSPDSERGALRNETVYDTVYEALEMRESPPPEPTFLEKLQARTLAIRGNKTTTVSPIVPKPKRAQLFGDPSQGLFPTSRWDEESVSSDDKSLFAGNLPPSPGRAQSTHKPTTSW